MAYVGDGSVWTYVPDNCRVDPSSATVNGSADFQILQWNSYVRGLLPSFTAGIVLGSLSIAGLIALVLTVCLGRRWRKRQAATLARQAPADNGAQFVVADGDAKAPTTQQPKSHAACGAARQALPWLVALLALAVVGVAAWGMAASIGSTDGLVDEFWLLVDDITSLVKELEAALASLGQSLATLSTTTADVLVLLQKVVDTIDNIPLVGGLLGRVIPLDDIRGFLGGQGDDAVAAMEQGSEVIQQSLLPIINDTILPALENFESNRDWSTNLQDTWRYVVFAVLFGLLILLSAAVGAACFKLRRLTLAVALVALLWVLDAVVCLLGLGLLNGAKTIANDACLYGEDAITQLVLERLDGDAQQLANSTLSYYLGRSDLTDSNGDPLLTNATTECTPELSAALLNEITGINLNSAMLLAWNLAELLPRVTGALNADLPSIPLVNLDLDTLIDPLLAAADALPAVLDDVCNVTLLLLRENEIQPLYFRLKTFVCCEITDAIYAVWLPWTVAGVLTLVLCLLASTHVITVALQPIHHTGGAVPDGVAADKGSFIVASDLAATASAPKALEMQPP